MLVPDQVQDNPESKLSPVYPGFLVKPGMTRFLTPDSRKILRYPTFFQRTE